jgi:hypothetical protein
VLHARFAMKSKVASTHRRMCKPPPLSPRLSLSLSLSLTHSLSPFFSLKGFWPAGDPEGVADAVLAQWTSKVWLAHATLDSLLQKLPNAVGGMWLLLTFPPPISVIVVVFCSFLVPLFSCALACRESSHPVMQLLASAPVYREACMALGSACLLMAQFQKHMVRSM